MERGLRAALPARASSAAAYLFDGRRHDAEGNVHALVLHESVAPAMRDLCQRRMSCKARETWEGEEMEDASHRHAECH